LIEPLTDRTICLVYLQNSINNLTDYRIDDDVSWHEGVTAVQVCWLWNAAGMSPVLCGSHLLWLSTTCSSRSVYLVCLRQSLVHCVRIRAG